MAVDYKHELLDQLAFHWDHIRGRRLVDLTDAEYRWEPVAGMANLRRRAETVFDVATGAGEWVMEQPDDSIPPPMTTIAWRLGHIAIDIFGIRASNHFGDGDLGRDSIVWEPSAEFGLALLDEHHQRWVAGVEAMSMDDLARPVGPAEGPFAEAPYAALVLHLNREALHHLAEVMLLRDLYRNRDSLRAG